METYDETGNAGPLRLGTKRKATTAIGITSTATFLVMMAIGMASTAGCGGITGQTPPGVFTATETGVGPSDSSAAVVFGFDATGKPRFAQADPLGTTWIVYSDASTQVWSATVTGVTATQLQALSGNYVVGEFDAADGSHGIAVAAVDSHGNATVAKYPGYRFQVSDGTNALVTAANDPSSFFVMDLTTGTVVAEPVPSGDAPYAMKGNFALLATGGSTGAKKRPRTRSVGGMVLFDLTSHIQVALQPVAGTDGSVYAAALNSHGEAVGITISGQNSQMRTWSPSGVPSAVLDTAVGGTLDANWISEDGTRISYDKTVGGFPGGIQHACVSIEGTIFDLRTTSLPLSSIGIINAANTAGFGYDVAKSAPVALGISYR